MHVKYSFSLPSLYMSVFYHLQRSQKLISSLPEDKQDFVTELRRKQLQKQMPLHDIDPRFCTSLAPAELVKFEKFAERRKKKAAGIGQIVQVKGTEGTGVSCSF